MFQISAAVRSSHAHKNFLDPLPVNLCGPDKSEMCDEVTKKAGENTKNLKI